MKKILFAIFFITIHIQCFERLNKIFYRNVNALYTFLGIYRIDENVSRLCKHLESIGEFKLDNLGCFPDEKSCRLYINCLKVYRDYAEYNSKQAFITLCDLEKKFKSKIDSNSIDKETDYPIVSSFLVLDYLFKSMHEDLNKKKQYSSVFIKDPRSILMQISAKRRNHFEQYTLFNAPREHKNCEYIYDKDSIINKISDDREWVVMTLKECRPKLKYDKSYNLLHCNNIYSSESVSIDKQKGIIINWDEHHRSLPACDTGTCLQISNIPLVRICNTFTKRQHILLDHDFYSLLHPDGLLKNSFYYHLDPSDIQMNYDASAVTIRLVEINTLYVFEEGGYFYHPKTYYYANFKRQSRLSDYTFEGFLKETNSIKSQKRYDKNELIPSKNNIKINDVYSKDYSSLETDNTSNRLKTITDCACDTASSDDDVFSTTLNVCNQNKSHMTYIYNNFSKFPTNTKQQYLVRARVKEYIQTLNDISLKDFVSAVDFLHLNENKTLLMVNNECLNRSLDQNISLNFKSEPYDIQDVPQGYSVVVSSANNEWILITNNNDNDQCVRCAASWSQKEYFRRYHEKLHTYCHSCFKVKMFLINRLTGQKVDLPYSDYFNKIFDGKSTSGRYFRTLSVVDSFYYKQHRPPTEFFVSNDGKQLKLSLWTINISDEWGTGEHPHFSLPVTLNYNSKSEKFEIDREQIDFIYQQLDRFRFLR